MLKGDKKKLERTSTSQINNNLSIKKKNDHDCKVFLKIYVSIEILQKKKGKRKKRKTSFATIGGNFLLLKSPYLNFSAKRKKLALTMMF